MKVRLKFKKYGVLKFIGHLDVMRYFQKVFRRSNIDIAYSQGFNPHQIMSFAAPLGVGITSDGEYVDVQLNSCDDPENFIKHINNFVTEGIEITELSILEDKAQNSMSIVSAADYNIYLKDEYKDLFEKIDCVLLSNKIKDFMNQSEILVMKKTKKSEKEVDIKPLIYDIYNDEKSFCIFMKIATGSVNNLKPELVMQALCRFLEIEYNKFAFQTHRLEVYADGENGELISLINKDSSIIYREA